MMNGGGRAGGASDRDEEEGAKVGASRHAETWTIWRRLTGIKDDERRRKSRLCK